MRYSCGELQQKQTDEWKAAIGDTKLQKLQAQKAEEKKAGKKKKQNLYMLSMKLRTLKIVIPVLLLLRYYTGSKNG